MEFLNTFDGEIIRQSDLSFQNNGIRKSVVQTHIDFTNSNGGIIRGLNVFANGQILIVTPGVFYTAGNFSTTNSQGGGERCELYQPVILSGLSQTPPINNQAQYLMVYISPSVSYVDPSINTSQQITSTNLETGIVQPIQQFTSGTIAISNPIFISQTGNFIGILPLALIQVDYVGTTQVSNSNYIQFISQDLGQNYVIGNSIDVATQQLLPSAIPNQFITSEMIGSGQVTQRNIPNNTITSNLLATWDGFSSGTTNGSGVDTGHIKANAITSSQLNITGSLYNFSEQNFIFNSSFELIPNTSIESVPVGWITSGTVFQVNTESYIGKNSICISGQALLYQNIQFFDYNINNQPISTFFYMKSSGTIPYGGINISLEFLSNGSGVTIPLIINNYSGTELNWTKFQLNSPIIYNQIPNINSLQILVSGNLPNGISVYLDNFYLGLTNAQPKWNPSVDDFNYSNVISLGNISTTGITNISNVLSTNNLYVENINAIGQGITTIGVPDAPYESIYTSNLYLAGEPLIVSTKNFIVFTGTVLPTITNSYNSITSGNVYSWVVPPMTTSIIAELVGGGGGGAAGDFLGAGGQGRIFGGGGGGGAAEYSKQSIAVIPGETLTIIAGAGGLGGLSVNFNSPVTMYFGSNGQSSSVLRDNNIVLAIASGGSGAGNISTSTIPGSGGGINLFSNGLINIAGNSGTTGGQYSILIPGGFGGFGGSGGLIASNQFQTGYSSNIILSGLSYGNTLSCWGSPGQLNNNGILSYNSYGTPGQFPGCGGGGGGGGRSFISGPGGAGGAGIVIIYY